MHTTVNVSFFISECPSGWVPLQENCYFFNNKHLSFEKAQKWCMDRNSTLFEPKDLETNQLVFETGKNVSETKGWKHDKNDKTKYIFFWIGIHDLHKEGNFTYVSDPNEHPIQWHNWNEGK